MRFAAIEMIRYGAHEQRRMEFVSRAPDLHLVVGSNAAGKSTMLRAFGDLLFGVGP